MPPEKTSAVEITMHSTALSPCIIFTFTLTVVSSSAVSVDERVRKEGANKRSQWLMYTQLDI